jgi:prepilin-type N-terminal cleavage/methylation domain-containing protein
MKNKKTGAARAGFTLIELVLGMVIISAVAIITALLVSRYLS